MKNKQLILFALSILVLALFTTACQPETVEVTRVVTETEEVAVEIEVPVEVTRVVTEVETVTETVVEEVQVEVEKAELGSEDRPIQVLFVPSVDADVIVSGGEVLAEELKSVTGLNFEVSV